MFELDMNAIRREADAVRLMANPAKEANGVTEPSPRIPTGGEISQKGSKLAGLAKVAISQDVSQQSAEMLLARLMASAMRVCDLRKDGDAARAEMRADVEDTPPELREDLLEYFREVLGTRYWGWWK